MLSKVTDAVMELPSRGSGKPPGLLLVKRKASVIVSQVRRAGITRRGARQHQAGDEARKGVGGYVRLSPFKLSGQL